MSSLTPTDHDLLALMLADETDDLDAIRSAGTPSDYPASFAQQRLWLWQQINPQGSAYNLPKALRLHGALDVQGLEVALQRVLERHQVLRTAFDNVDGVARQRVVPVKGPLLRHVDLVQVPVEEREAVIVQHMQNEAEYVFDLTQAPLLRGLLLGVAPEEHVLMLTLHHIVSDAWSNPLLLQDMFQAYLSASQGDTAALPALPIQYGDYAHWQREVYPQGAAYERAKAYWQAYLAEPVAPLQLPTDRLGADDRAAGFHHMTLPKALVDSLHRQCERQGLTPFAFLLGAWQLLLGRYSGQSSFAVGVPNAARNRVETQALVGYFINTQVYRAQLDEARPSLDFLHDVRRHALAALEHSDYPIELLAREAGGPLFQTLFNWRAGAQGEQPLSLGGLVLDFMSVRQREAKFDLSIDVDYGVEAIDVVLEYRAALFDAQTVARLGEYWVVLMEALAHDPRQAIGRLPLLNPAQYEQAVADWNPEPTDHASPRCLHELIEAQVRRAPQATAVVLGDLRLTYDQLNRRANQLARRLREAGVGPDILVGLALERSLELVVAVLAVLKAGGAYVPLDPQYPHERLAYMLQDSGVALLVTRSGLLEQVPMPHASVRLELDAHAGELQGYDETDLEPATMPDNLAYVIYTSGSTGKPKGTLLPHRNVVRLFQATQEHFQFDHRDVWSVFHSYAFDFSVWELFGALVHGGRAVMVPKDVARSPEDFHALLAREQVTVLNQTPSAFSPLIPVACQGAPLALRYVIFGGEALDVRTLAPWFDHFGDAAPQLVNMYGITETTVHVTWRPLGRQDLEACVTSPLGAVIRDLSLYVLDGDLAPAAPGTLGELHVGRAGLARGYHGRPALTAERFVPDPFDRSEAGGGRLYRAGDLARYRGRGEVEYAGRLDHQVKIRGFRIELGEIQARLVEHAGVATAAVVDIDAPGGRQLVAYLVAQKGGATDARELSVLRSEVREHLKASLPEHMVPAHLVWVDVLPLTPNGKLDRTALPPPDGSELQGQHVAPKPGLQSELAAIWDQVLGLGQVGVTDNFFELGGHSLLATQVVSRIRSELGADISLVEFFRQPTIAELAQIIQRRKEEMDPVAAILSKSLMDLKRLTAGELNDLIS